MRRASAFPVIVMWNDPTTCSRASLELVNSEALTRQVSYGLLASDRKNYFVIHSKGGGEMDFTVIPKVLVTKIIKLKPV